jgi:hypothetical protein
LAARQRVVGGAGFPRPLAIPVTPPGSTRPAAWLRPSLDRNLCGEGGIGYALRAFLASQGPSPSLTLVHFVDDSTPDRTLGSLLSCARLASGFGCLNPLGRAGAAASRPPPAPCSGAPRPARAWKEVGKTKVLGIHSKPSYRGTVIGVGASWTASCRNGDWESACARPIESHPTTPRVPRMEPGNATGQPRATGACFYTCAVTSDPIPSAPFDDLDIDRDEDDEEWERRLMQLAGQRVQAARDRLEHLGVVDAEGELVFAELPSDMRPDSDTTLETG